MSKFQRIGSIIVGIIMLAGSVAMIVFPEYGYIAVVVTLSISLILAGIRSLVYYFKMARHMVGGKTVLYQGIIVLDLGLFAASLFDVSQIYIMLFLIGTHAFSGFVDIMRALESKRLDAADWKLNVTHGVVNIAIAVLCIVFIGSLKMAVIIYSLGLIYSAVVRIWNATRNTAIVYIQ